jgi:hypothetical protein
VKQVQIQAHARCARPELEKHPTKIKTMKKASVFLFLGILVLFNACRQSGMQEQLQGVWELKSMDIINRSDADTDYLFMIEEANMMGLYFGMNGLLFRERKDVVIIRDGFSLYEDYKLGYRLVDRNGRLDENGRTIEILLLETPHEFTGVSEPPGPFEILSLSAGELILKDLNPNTVEITRNNMALRFVRLD